VAALTIPSWARKGAKVVLVDNSPGRLDGYVCSNPDRIFTICEVCVEAGRVGCRVAEWRYDHFEYTDINRFRPLVDDANDAETEREIYRRKVHQNAAPVKALERT
jgi:hypothetical protein